MLNRHLSPALFVCLIACLTWPLARHAAAADLPFDEPLFDHNAIQNDPLEIEVISEKVVDGLILREFTFNGGKWKTKTGSVETIRIEAKLVMPEAGDDLPGVLWCQGGMAPANWGMPKIYGRKGYACIAITLPHDKFPAWDAWDASDPKAANLSIYGHFQMRGVTALAQLPRVDADNLAVAGASYGGFFSTLVAGADPRIKAGASFFTGGHHALGSNLPQFTKMPDQQAVDTWMRTIDPAWRHEKRDVPFLWTLPTNDNWFYFPAVIETYRRARSSGKRLAIVPSWTHGFPPNIDQEIFDFFDVHLKRTRDPYVQPSPVLIRSDGETLRAEFSLDGPVKDAFVVVSPNAPAAGESPWAGQWRNRLHQPLPTTMSKDSTPGTADIPVLDPSRPMYVYLNVIDANDVVTSTLPVLISPPYAKNAAAGEGVFNGMPWGEFEAEDVTTLTGQAHWPGFAESEMAHRGEGSVRVPGNVNHKLGKRRRPVKLFHVPYLSHRLEVAVRGDGDTAITVSVAALPPANWDTPAVTAIMGERPTFTGKSQVVASKTVQPNGEWQLIKLDVPAPENAIEGYVLKLDANEGNERDWWYDSIRFTPVPVER